MGVDVCLRGMEFESAENLAPRAVGLLRRAAVEGPSCRDLLSVGEMKGGAGRVVFNGVDGDAMEEGDVRGSGKFFQGDFVKLVGGDADVGGADVSARRPGPYRRSTDKPVVPAVGDGGVERGLMQLPVTPSAVVWEF